MRACSGRQDDHQAAATAQLSQLRLQPDRTYSSKFSGVERADSAYSQQLPPYPHHHQHDTQGFQQQPSGPPYPNAPNMAPIGARGDSANLSEADHASQPLGKRDSGHGSSKQAYNLNSGVHHADHHGNILNAVPVISQAKSGAPLPLFACCCNSSRHPMPAHRVARGVSQIALDCSRYVSQQD